MKNILVAISFMLFISSNLYARQKVKPMQLFKSEGPFSFSEERDYEIRISKDEVVSTDIFLVDSEKKRPLLIFQHGNKAHKGVHLYQARRAASWGFNVITVSQPNVKRWMTNGKVLGEFVSLLHKWPKILNDKFDPEKMILIGHSFGGSAASIAAGSGAPVKGVILLDPALVSDKVVPFLKNINVNVVLLGADTKVFRSRKRSRFYKNINSDMVEISVKGATHNDAQSPNLFSLKQTIGLEHGTNSEKQNFFVSSILTAAYSMVKKDNLSIFYKAMKKERKSGKLKFLKI